MPSNPPDIYHQDLPQLLNSVEKELLLLIMMNMKHRKITIGEAQKLAQDFISMLPATDKEDLLNKLNDLGKTYKEARDVYARYATTYEDQKKEDKLTQMREHIKSGEIEEAISVAKGENK